MAMNRAFGAWPLVGRDEELALLRKLRAAPKPVNAVVSGVMGVGKSSLARTALAEAAAEGWATLAIHGNTSMHNVPLGPLRTVLGIEGAQELSELSAAVATGLGALRAGKGLLVLADDCHELDEPSAALLCQLVAAGSIVCVFTARSGAAMPVPVTSLWKDGLAERIELQNLSRRETSELLTAGLSGPIEDASATRIWTLTEGNPLYLHEVVLSGVETGALKPTGEEWQWRGEWASGARLQEIVAARLSRLDPEQSGAMEFLALAGSLPIDLLSRLASGDAVEALEAHGLVRVGFTATFDVEIAQPVHAEVLRKNMLPLRRRAIWRNLVEELQALGVQGNADRVRLAWWSIEAGLVVDPLTLSVGTGASVWAIGHAISARLHEVFTSMLAHPRVSTRSWCRQPLIWPSAWRRPPMKVPAVWPKESPSPTPSRGAETSKRLSQFSPRSSIVARKWTTAFALRSGWRGYACGAVTTPKGRRRACGAH